MTTIASDVASGVIGEAAVQGGRALMHRIRQHFRCPFWGRAASNQITIINPLYDEKHLRLEDVIACEKLQKHFGYKRCKSVPADREVPTNSHLVLLCSPKGNQKSSLFLAQVGLAFRFLPKLEPVSGKELYCFQDAETQQCYFSPQDCDPSLKVDYALIARLTEYTPPRKVFLLWGLHGIGTLGAAEFASTPALIAQLHLEGDQDFAALLQVQYRSRTELLSVNVLHGPKCC